MKRSMSQMDGCGDAAKPPAKKAATAKKAALNQKPTAEEAPPTINPAPNGRMHLAPLGPTGELMIPQIFPEECMKAIEKMALPPRWISAIDGTPGREHTLKNRKWWETNMLWLMANKTSIGLTAKHWKMKDEALANGEPIGDDEGCLPDEFICIFPQKRGNNDDDEDEEEEEEEEDDDNHENEGEGDEENTNKKETKKTANDEREAASMLVGKLASLHPDHKWVASLRGYQRQKWWTQEILKRDQDDYALHVYNDFSWYGCMEVIENLFVNFEKILKRKTHTPLELWQELEGLALVLNTGFVQIEMADDSERVGRILELYGYMAITVVNSLQKEGLFTKDSQIPNIALILSLFVEYLWTIGSEYDWEDEVTWVFHVVEQAEAAGIALGGPNGFDKRIAEIKEKASKQTAASRSKWTKGTFARKFGAYGSRGGEQYVIAKMPAAQRKKYSYAGGLMF